MTPDFSVYTETPSAPIALIATPGAEELAQLIDKRLISLFSESHLGKKLHKDTFILKSDCPRFTNGDAKGIIYETVRGKDLYIICDPGNHGVTYPFFGKEIPLTPDEHFQNLKRIICACTGKPARITVIMPMLYGGRQHRRSARESLDCAQMLQELQSMGVTDIITFDAHDPRVQNSVPFMGFDNYFAHYQILKCLTRRFPEVKLQKDSLMVISPDEGAMTRNVFYASVLGLDLGMFYKRRDYSTIINGRNPIVAHEYIGANVEGMNVFVADDMIATGDSILKLAKEIKEKGAKKVFLAATFSLFTEGVEKFNKAYEEGIFDAVLSTNLTYRIPELKECEWFVEADLSKYISYIIAAANVNESVANLLDPSQKIRELVETLNG
ncbi:MAG TPA: phosphoribosylpyrophosphate synthetase [Clostridiales bacterium]|mgnify:FL=1|nr:phosphoribosylpyrophosphate synthetase [Clostridiales bacterium]HBW05379.1 phosphoribosylpyrophosphate synthetase [Clostridiales bacterium]HCH92250.1 phosphoribosylpyrophosphate synthetase [Clostridiales bacterium]